MTFIYDGEEPAILSTIVNGHRGVAVHLEPSMWGFGESDAYLGDELLFEDKDFAIVWARSLLAQLTA